MNDGVLATDSTTTWNSYGASDEEYPATVELNWGDAAYDISSVRVCGGRDYGGVMPPSGLYASVLQ